MTSDLSETTRLEPGQSLRLAVDAGASLLVMEGRVRIVSPPSWFGDTVFSVENNFDEGEAYLAGRGGWIEVTALAPVRLRGVPQSAPAVPAVSSRVARLVQLLFAS
ncbi:hypothetical protein SAMN05444679_104275 [Variovorax sp. CF079]|uniref:hypothetical protein n=1 Tax=Variovorax sp. CF079 TaxID=1882774 RepID=UPI000885C242|nr:hypothetical protein [Variovorax sp. CF079]SDC67344.1 hypothetical protein SAMN05444679_104275 [Variovorax sp. CF079]